MRQKIILLIAALFCLGMCVETYAMNTLSFYGGNNYVLGNKNTWTLEFLYAGAWKYGDNLYFFEITNPHRDVTTIVGDWYSRLSYRKITGKQLKLGPISDLSATTALGVSGLNERVYGLGLGVDWDLPLFSQMVTNLYWSHNDNEQKSTYQLVSVWVLPIIINTRLHMTFGGYAQWTGPVGRLKHNVLLEPSLMLDVGNLLHLSGNKLYLGIQYAYWHNMLGIKGVTESLPELKLSWAF